MSDPQNTKFKKLELGDLKLSQNYKNDLVDGGEFDRKFGLSKDAQENLKKQWTSRRFCAIIEPDRENGNYPIQI